MGIKSKIFGLLVLLIGLYWGFGFSDVESKLVETKYNGVYQFEDGRLATIVPSNSERLRMRMYEDGQVYSMYYEELGSDNFKISSGFSSSEFIASGTFEKSDLSEITGLAWKASELLIKAKKLDLISKEYRFKSGELELRGKLTLPQGEGPFPVVVMIHGSESFSGVDYYHLPYLLAAQGVAGFKFDKRGTGQSDGTYTQHFPTLATDVVSAVKLLQTVDDIDSNKINLAGFSQGGWIAPLVAEQVSINSFLVGFGCAIPVQREDRWGYVRRLQERGFGEKEIALVDAINKDVEAITDYDDESGWERLIKNIDTHQEKAWFQAIVGSDSILGKIAEYATMPGSTIVPTSIWKMVFDWERGEGPFLDRTYDPKITLNKIDTPSTWLLASDDSSAPTYETTEVLDELKNNGKEVSYRVYENSEHGNILYSINEDGEKVYLGYAPDYFKDIVKWFTQQNSIE